jgi:hypothetical protein
LIRRTVLFLFASGLLGGGGYLLFLSLTHPTFYSILRGAVMAAFFMGLGGYLLWEDFIKPSMVKRK